MLIFVILISDAGTEPRDSVRPRLCKQRLYRCVRRSPGNVATFLPVPLRSSRPPVPCRSRRCRQFERIRNRGLPFLHAGNHIRAAEPVRFGEISRRPLCRMVRMRMIKADDVLSALAAFPLDANQFARIDVIAVLRRIRTRVAATSDRTLRSRLAIHLAKQNSAAFVRIGLLAVPTKSVVIFASRSSTSQPFTSGMHTESQRCRSKRRSSVSMPRLCDRL